MLSSKLNMNRIGLLISKRILCKPVQEVGLSKFTPHNFSTNALLKQSLFSTFHYSKENNSIFHKTLTCAGNWSGYLAFAQNGIFLNQLRHLTVHHIDRPSPETTRKNLRYKVHYPEDGKYTIKPLRITKLGGRDPETGRKIFGRIGGGHKQKFRWVINNRVPPESKDPLIERVINIQYDPIRTSRIALVGHDDQLRYIIASSTMAAGDLITSTRELPRNTIRPKEGDAHPVGALPVGTVICCIETLPNAGAQYKIHGGTSATVSRHQDGKVLVRIDAYRVIALDPNCLVTVGRVSNDNHSKKVIGSPQRLRWLGFRQRSGLWQRKDGRYGYRPKKVQPVKHFAPPKPKNSIVRLTVRTEGPRRKIVPSTNRVT